jgi:hypothetical protein
MVARSLDMRRWGDRTEKGLANERKYPYVIESPESRSSTNREAFSRNTERIPLWVGSGQKRTFCGD